MENYSDNRICYQIKFIPFSLVLIHIVPEPVKLCAIETGQLFITIMAKNEHTEGLDFRRREISRTRPLIIDD